MISAENLKQRIINNIRERLNASASWFANVNNNGNANNNGASNTRDGLRPLVIENLKSSQPMAQRGTVSCPKGKFDSGCGRLRLNAIHRIYQKMDKSEIITYDANNLLKAYRKTVKSSRKKPSTKKFETHELDEINRAQEELHNRTWEIEKTSPFIINERGHVRKIQGNTPYDRMIIHSYLDFVLQPILEPYIIYDNYASQDDKGTSLARERFELYLHRAYRRYGHNKFYVLFIDFSKFYDNVRHDKLEEALFRIIPDEEFHHYMIDTILDSFKVDVSYMDDEEYSNCLNEKYVALDHIDYRGDGEKFMRKSLNIGNQGSQIFSIFFPTPVDNYCRIVRGIKDYGRYMDDSSMFSDSKDFLRDVLSGVREICDDMGIFINEKKTHIYRVDKPFKYLNRIYSVTETGHIKISLSNSTYNRERRKLKRFRGLLDGGTMEYKRIENQFLSWLGSNKKHINKKQMLQIKELYETLFGDLIDRKNTKLCKKLLNRKEKNVQNKISGRNGIEKSCSEREQLHLADED